MKNLKYLITILNFILLSSLGAQLNLSDKLIPNVKPIKGDYLYMAQTEVTNIQYREFLYWLNHNGKENVARINHPDTSVWQSRLGYTQPFVHYYFPHPAYQDYPVVGVTQTQADVFCLWMRDRLLENFKKDKNNPITDILVRLPTTEEWRHAARGGLDKNAVYPWPGETIRVTEGKKWAIGKIRLNTMVGKGDLGGIAGDGLNDAGFITTPVFAYWPNGYELYNIAGNVAEWTSKPGEALGGAWSQSPYFAKINVNGFNGNSPEPRSDIGFRYIVEIVKINSELPVIKKLTSKRILKEFAKVDSTLFAGKYEISNEWFNTFIKNSGQTGYTASDDLWEIYSPYQYRGMYSSFEGTREFPVVNISYEAAEAYCAWLTKVYHSQDKRKFKKVKFRLPSIEEWHNAARGGLQNQAYPWGGPYMRNSKGAFLANFLPIPESSFYQDRETKREVFLPFDTALARMEDGLEFTGPIDSYFPNNFGLYNCSGNAAEMVSTKGKSFGGSWNSHYEKLMLFNSVLLEGDGQNILSSTYEEYSGPAPTLGFRIFMEVLEE